MTLSDDLAAAIAAYRHIGVLWHQRHQPLVRLWVREYLLRIRCVQDQVLFLAAAMRREQQEARWMQDDDTQALTTI
jgi:hypothetical protein